MVRPRDLLLPVLVMLGGLPASPASAQETGSLEKYLERARLEREALHARLAPQVEALLARAAKSEQAPPDSRVNELAMLGSEATPLLVTHLDPGEGAEVGARRVADFAARALARMEPAPVVNDLLHMLEKGTPSGRLRAAGVLANVPDVAPVRAALRSTYDTSSGPLKRACLQSLVALGGEQTATLLAEVLRASDQELVDMALRALTVTRNASSASGVALLLADPLRATRHSGGILGFYKALPDLADESVIEDLVNLATGTAPTEVKLAVLDALPIFKPRLSPLRRRLTGLTESRDRDLREGAQVALATLGDRSARRSLLEPYDDGIDDNKRWSQAWSRRADVLLRIGDYDGAIRDYKEALDLAEDHPAPDRRNCVHLARCYALKGKPREAAEWLRSAPISLKELRELADDPDFAELRASRWGPKAFALEELP